MATEADDVLRLQPEKTRTSTVITSPRTSPERCKATQLGNDRLKNAKLVAETAVKNRKVFTIQGPYPFVRESLRSRGWVEQFYKVEQAVVKKQKPTNDNNSSDSDDDDPECTCDGDGNIIDVNDYGGQVVPWEEENGFYGITSRLVRNATPTFIWGVRRDCVDHKSLKKDQVINHYGHTSFTTKVGLCMHLRDLPWFEQATSEAFFPRCYRLSHDEDKESFIDDYVLTACVSLLKHIVGNDSDISPCSVSCDSVTPLTPRATTSVATVPSIAITAALEHCQRYIKSVDNEDLDTPVQTLTDADKSQLIQWHYKIVLENSPVQDVERHRSSINAVLGVMRQRWLQFDIDGTHNVWIVKPGAKSRGRGIQCYNRLDDILKLVNAQVVQKDSKFVVQKYIERPLLIYRTKFDIRQWFVVTDWNPFTLWFYRDCYLRFCSQEYTLDTFDESVHLSNNSIQKYYKNGKRAAELPEDNMWHCDDFKEYLRERNSEDLWDSTVYPGMKNAVICALLCCQDDIEQRKSAFELYGADFMLDEKCHPWLIEINSSPCMAASTKITAKMCRSVLEDTMKVVLDRRTDRNADTGLFELAYRQPVVAVPSYVGINLQVEGQIIKKPAASLASRNDTQTQLSAETEILNQLSPSNHSKVNNKTLDLSAFCLTNNSLAITATAAAPTTTSVPSKERRKTVNRLKNEVGCPSNTTVNRTLKNEVTNKPLTKQAQLSVKKQNSQQYSNQREAETSQSENSDSDDGEIEATTTATKAAATKFVHREGATFDRMQSLLTRNKTFSGIGNNSDTSLPSRDTGDNKNQQNAQSSRHLRRYNYQRHHHRRYSRKQLQGCSETETTSVTQTIDPATKTSSFSQLIDRKKQFLAPAETNAPLPPTTPTRSLAATHQKAVTTSNQIPKPVALANLGSDSVPSYSLSTSKSLTMNELSHLPTSSNLLSLAPQATPNIQEKYQDKTTTSSVRPAETLVSSYVPPPFMPYFASRQYGLRRGVFIADNPAVSKIRYSHTSPQFSSSRLGAHSRSDLMQLSQTISITGLRNSTMSNNSLLYSSFL